MSPMKLKTWIESERGRATALAKAIGVPSSFVSKMVSGEKAIPAEHCKTIEALTLGQVTCQEMRPNDWQKYWPELDAAHVPIAQAAIETVAHEPIQTTDTGALRSGSVRRHAERRAEAANRRAQEAAAERDRRAKGGPPFQGVDVGDA